MLKEISAQRNEADISRILLAIKFLTRAEKLLDFQNVGKICRAKLT